MTKAMVFVGTGELWEPNREKHMLRFGRSSDAHTAKERFKRMIDDLYYEVPS